MLKAYETYKKFIVIMNKVIDVVTIALMLGMVGVVSYQVFMRQFFASPPIWGEEISVTLLVWFVFLGIVLGLEEGLHIGIAMFVSKFPKKVVYGVEIFVNLLILLLAILFVYYGTVFASNMIRFGTALPATGMPAYIHYIVVPITGVLMGVVILGKIAGQLIKQENKQEKEEESHD